mmetsp:Transcript_32116/g.92176  ORF Transcript_32116/g.92176 Transcript_32116/m.92176 type:complete len:375 (+) Transcript_32116:56-1180(+)
MARVTGAGRRAHAVSVGSRCCWALSPQTPGRAARAALWAAVLAAACHRMFWTRTPLSFASRTARPRPDVTLRAASYSHGPMLVGSKCATWRSRSLTQQPGRRGRSAMRALDVDGVASFASFSVLGGAPIPLLFSALFRRAEAVEAERNGAKGQPTPRQPVGAGTADTGEPRGLMWAFPSFAVFLEDAESTAPAGLPMWVRWLCLATFWPGLLWYLYYKIAVEEDLRQYRGLGIGGYIVIVPFAVGLAAGIFGEVAYGSLEGGPLDDAFSAAFYAAFAWIYLNQWFLYNKVNQLFQEEGRPAPLDPWGLLVPGWNFVTGIRQIHFLAEYWAQQRGEELPRDAFAELFPFARKPTLSLGELITSPQLWIDTGRLVG